MAILFTLVPILILGVSSLAAAEQSLNIEYILDASNSMNEALPSGETKIAVAKKVVCNLIDNIAAEAQGNVNVGLRIYGANFNASDTKQKACMDSVLEIPIKGIQADKIKQKVNSIKAAGYTPIAYSLELASKDFTKSEENANTIILVSDGEETCGGDPVAVIKKLKSQGFNIVVHCIGFSVTEKAREQLKAIAKASGGTYYSADNADQLISSLKKVTDRAFESYEAPGEKIEPAQWISKAPEVQIGEYQWTIAMQERQYYKIKAYKGQKIKATMIVKKTPYDAMNNKIFQTFAVKLFNNVYDTVAEKETTVAGNPTDPVTFKAQWEADRTGWVYIAASATNNHGKDNNPCSVYPEGAIPEPSPYTLKIKVKGDIPEVEKEKEFVTLPTSDEKGGTSFKKAPETKLNTAYDGTIYMKEIRYFKIPVTETTKKIVVHAVTSKPWYSASNWHIRMKYKIIIYDEDWAEVTSKEITIDKNPATPFSLKAECDVADNDEMFYSLAASTNLATWGMTENAEVEIHPKGFQPKAQNYTVLATEE